MELTVSQAQVEQRTQPVSNWKVWAGRVMGGLAVAFLAFDAVIKLILIEPVREGFAHGGYPGGVARPIGALLLACVTLYVIPRTSILGAVLLTGYLGGAIDSHVRLADPLFSHTLFPIYFGIMLWGSLLLRDERLRALFPLRK